MIMPKKLLGNLFRLYYYTVETSKVIYKQAKTMNVEIAINRLKE